MPLTSTTAIADGVLPHGSFDITILETALSYIADNFNFDVDVKVLRSNNSQGNPGRQKFIKGFVDGSVDLQLADNDTPTPDMGHFFVADADKDGTAEPYAIVKPGRTFEADGIFKCKATIARCVNPVIYGVSGKTTDLLAAGITNATGGAITSIALGAYLPPGDVITSAVWSATGLPTGISINASTGALTGTPTVAGPYTAVITVTLANGKKGRRSFVWTIT